MVFGVKGRDLPDPLQCALALGLIDFVLDLLPESVLSSEVCS